MTPVSTFEHRFPIMILFSILVFIVVIRIVLKKQEFIKKQYRVYILSIIVVVLGMLFGKYGANLGLQWWIYYPIPMLITVLLPPVALKMNLRRSFLYILLSFLSAPFIHFFFSFFLNWNEYMPFWKIGYIGNI
jgi:hypothetical protein